MKKLAALVVVAAFGLAGCGGGAGGSTVTVGSAAFPENEIIAEIYAQALEAKGVQVAKKLNIGAREAYIPALKGGEINVIPEYSGNLLTYLDPKATATAADDVEAALAKALPAELKVLDAAVAEDKDSLNVTSAFAKEHGLKSIADLAKVKGLRLAANPEFSKRSYGIPGLEKVYGITGVQFTPISDGGGPATLKALLDGKVDVADIYSTTPSIVANKLVTLDDPKSLIAAQNVVPLVSAGAPVTKTVIDTLNAVSAKLTTEDLLELNGANQGEDKAAPAVLAKQWLTDNGLL